MLTAAPSLIFHHGKVIAVDNAFTIHTALAIEGPRITAVGSDDEIFKLKGAQTRLVDLGGKTVLPGLIDSHTHPTGACMTEWDHPIPEMESIPGDFKVTDGGAGFLEKDPRLANPPACCAIARAL